MYDHGHRTTDLSVGFCFLLHFAGATASRFYRVGKPRSLAGSMVNKNFDMRLPSSWSVE
jgi:hypothetical protein